MLPRAVAVPDTGEVYKRVRFDDGMCDIKMVLRHFRSCNSAIIAEDIRIDVSLSQRYILPFLGALYDGF